MTKTERPFASILCPVDLSATSRAAVRKAGELADYFEASLLIIFVDDPLIARAALRFDEDELDRRTRAELARFVERAIGPKQRCTYEIVAGQPPEEILKAAKRVKADLIVMGTQGQRAPFFGSTAEAVLRQTTIPVMAVPPAKR
jgi:nucleotide-binding universal stress UspA family protein